MLAIEKRVLDFIALATPANDDREPCTCNVRAVSGSRIDRLVADLEAAKLHGKTFERPQKIVLHPAAWVRRQMAIEGVLRG